LTFLSNNLHLLNFYVDPPCTETYCTLKFKISKISCVIYSYEQRLC